MMFEAHCAAELRIETPCALWDAAHVLFGMQRADGNRKDIASASACGRLLCMRTLLGAAAVLSRIAVGRAEADSSSPTIRELKELNVEDLMNVEVTSVSRHPQKLLGKLAWRY